MEDEVLMIGFGYDWDKGIKGLEEVNYKPCLAYFDNDDFCLPN